VILVSPTEPDEIQALGRTSSLPEAYGVDFMFAVRGQLYGVQRKEFPNDFLASLSDGRLQKEALRMKYLSVAVLMLEGKPRWTLDGGLIHENVGLQFTRRQLRGLLWSFTFCFGVCPEWTDDISDTIAAIQSLYQWARKEEHVSLTRRPKRKDAWGDRLSGQDQAIYFLQGLPGIGPKLAGRIYEHFGCLPLVWTCGKEELARVSGVGPRRAEVLWTALRGHRPK